MCEEYVLHTLAGHAIGKANVSPWHTAGMPCCPAIRCDEEINVDASHAEMHQSTSAALADKSHHDMRPHECVARRNDRVAREASP